MTTVKKRLLFQIKQYIYKKLVLRHNKITVKFIQSSLNGSRIRVVIESENFI